VSRGNKFFYSHRDPAQYGEQRNYHIEVGIDEALHPYAHIERDRLDRELEEYLINLGKWHDFTPVWDTTLGVDDENGTWTEARYTRIGNTVHFACMYTVGSTFSTGGAGQERWEFTQAAGLIPYNQGPYIAWTRYRDVGSDNYYAPGSITGSTTTYFNVYSSGATSGTNFNINTFSATVPFSFTEGDEMYFEGTFEAEPVS
jgi:hypothetical protein